MTIRIKGWSKFQHFKDRRPPWIKLYRDLLDDYDWHELDPKAAKMLIMLWLIASENSDGELPDVKTIAFRLRLSVAEAKLLISKLSHWLINDDINVISERYQNDAPETETEVETKTEIKTETELLRTKKNQNALSAPEGVTTEVWNSFLEQRKKARAVVTPTVIKRIEQEAEKAGWTLNDALAECAARGWRGFSAKWVEHKFEEFSGDLPY